MRIWTLFYPVLLVLAACQMQSTGAHCSEKVTLEEKDNLTKIVWPEAKRIEASSDPNYDLAKHLDWYTIHFFRCNKGFRVVFTPIQNEELMVVGWKSTFVVDLERSLILDHYQK